MATLLETYISQRGDLDECLKKEGLTAEQVWQYQELIYRIGALQTCQMLTKTAPASMNMNMLVVHYRLSDAYFQQLMRERMIGPVTDEEGKKRRETAQNSLNKIILDYRKRFSSFCAEAPDQYPREISKVVNTVLPAWIQYRNTFLDIKTAKGGK